MFFAPNRAMLSFCRARHPLFMTQAREVRPATRGCLGKVFASTSFVSMMVVTLGCSPSEATAPTSASAETRTSDASDASTSSDAMPLVDAGDSGATPAQPPDWSAAILAPLAVDESPKRDVFETHLEAAPTLLEIVPGTTTEVWTYNGSL